MKQVTFNVYAFNELTEKVREKVKERYYDMCHSNEEFNDTLQYDWKEAFGDTDMPEIQYDFSGSQGSGVNIYTESFDYFTYGEYKYQQTGFDYYRDASKILSNDYFILPLVYNERYTYSLLGRDFSEILRVIVEDFPDRYQCILTEFIKSLFKDLEEFETRVWSLGKNYFDDMTDELYAEYLQDYYFFADGKDYSDIYESV